MFRGYSYFKCRARTKACEHRSHFTDSINGDRDFLGHLDGPIRILFWISDVLPTSGKTMLQCTVRAVSDTSGQPRHSTTRQSTKHKFAGGHSRTSMHHLKQKVAVLAMQAGDKTHARLQDQDSRKHVQVAMCRTCHKL